MKQSFLAILLCLSLSTFGQYAPFKKYDFSKGGYSLLGIRDESDFNKLAAQLGEFYTDDIATLNEIKSKWVFTKKSPQFSCGYHYTVILCKNGKVLEGFNINLNCEEIATDKGDYYFDAQKLSLIKDKLKKPIVNTLTFKTVTDARAYLAKARSDKNQIVIPYAQWEKYDGEFRFDFKFKSPDQDREQSRKKLLKQLETDIRKSYPNELFALSDVGGSTKDMTVQVSCRKSLRDKFKLYTVNEFFSWDPYTLSLTTYSFQKSGNNVVKK